MAKVLVIGEALIDQIKTLSNSEVRNIPGGSPANVALGLGRLMDDVTLATWIGNDLYGERIVKHLQTANVKVIAESMKANHTSTAVANITADGSAQYEFDIQWQMPPIPWSLGPDIIHFGSIAAFLEPGASQILQFLDRALAATIVTFDPNIRPALMGSPEATRKQFENILTYCDVVKMSDEDAAWLYPGLEPAAIAAKMFSHDVMLFALTKSNNGAEIWAHTGIKMSHANFSGEVVDTVGAGDSFMAALIHGLVQYVRRYEYPKEAMESISGIEIGVMLERCLRAAAITVSREGADLPWLAELNG